MSTAAEQGFDRERLARIPARIEADNESGRDYAVALCISRRGHTGYREVRGYADRVNPRKLAEGDTLMPCLAGR